MKAIKLSLGIGAFLLANFTLLVQGTLQAEETSCTSCEKKIVGGCANGECSSGGCRSGFRKICGHNRTELPIIANPACYGHFQTQWQVFPCSKPATEPEKEMPKVKEEAPENVKPAVFSKNSKVLKVQPAVRTLPSN